MKPAPLILHRPRSVEEATGVLAEVGHDGKVLAGGQSLIPLLSMRLASPAALVDINAVRDLDAVTVHDSVIEVGALVRHAELERDDAAHRANPLLRQALALVAHPTIRNRGTTVGSICHADPSGELPAVLALLGGRLRCASTAGVREIPVDELFVGPLETSLHAEELAVAAIFPALPERTGTSVVEVSRRHGDYAVCGVAALVTLDGDGAVTSARTSYVTGGDTPPVIDLTAAVRGTDPRDLAAPSWLDAAELAHAQLTPDGDIHASAAYRRHLVRILTARALRQAAERAIELGAAA